MLNLKEPHTFKLNGQEVKGRGAAFNLAEELGWFSGFRRPAWLEHTINGFEDGDFVAPFSGSNESREALLKSLRAAGKWSRSDNRHRLLVWNCSTLEDAQRFQRPRLNNRYKVEGTRVTFMPIEWRKLAKKRSKRRNEARAEKAWMNEGNYVHKASFQYDFWNTMELIYGDDEPDEFDNWIWTVQEHSTEWGVCCVSGQRLNDLCDACYKDLYASKKRSPRRACKAS